MRHLYPAPFPMERSFVGREVRSQRARYKHLASSLGGVAPPPPRELARRPDTQGALNRACIWKHLLDEQQAVCHGAPKMHVFYYFFAFVLYLTRRPPSYKPGGFWRSPRRSYLVSY